jgi:hypothetical protein
LDQRARALAGLLAEALAHGVIHLALAAGEVLHRAHLLAVVAAQAHALELLALRHALRGRRGPHLCTTKARTSRFSHRNWPLNSSRRH